MLTINVRKRTSENGHLFIDVPTNIIGKEVEVVLVIQENENVFVNNTDDSMCKKKFDFSHLYGKLQWKGDALAEQIKIRSEWE